MEEIMNISEYEVSEAMEDVDYSMLPINKKSSLYLFLRDVSRIHRLTQEETAELFKKKAVAPPEEAAQIRKAIVQGHLRLVIHFAKHKYFALQSQYTVQTSLEDLIQDGCMGLMTAVDRFDITQDVKFGTYATYWVLQTMTQGIDAYSRSIKVPPHVATKIASMQRASAEIESILGRQPTIDELASIFNFQWAKSELLELQGIATRGSVGSLNAMLGDSPDDGQIADIVPNDDESLDEDVERMERTDTIAAAAGKLSERDQFVIVHCFGLFETEKMTLDEIAAELFKKGFTNMNGKVLSKERIRQIRDDSCKAIAPYLKKLIL